MAITAVEYTLFRQMREQNALPLGSDILELGEANWYGDVPVDALRLDIGKFGPDALKPELLDRLDVAAAGERGRAFFDIAKIWWTTFWQPSSMTAIDFHGTDVALKLDLNFPIDLPRRYGAVTNLGTAEHVFNVGQVLKTMHDYTLPGGLMLHGLPMSGWIDHGFYSFNSTFYWDLARANQYGMLLCVYTELKPLKLVQLANREAILDLARNKQIGANSMIYAVMKKPGVERPFEAPMQGYYSGTVSAEATKTWKDLR